MISDKNSFAYISARDRWPVILVCVPNPFSILGANTRVQTQAVDDVFKHASNYEAGTRKQEGNKIVAQIAQLKYELQHDRTITWVSLSLHSVLQG